MSQISAALNNIPAIKPEETPRVSPRLSNPAGAESFNSVFKGQINNTTPAALPPKPASLPPSGLKFSAHAIDRLRSRGISFDQDMLKRIESAVDKAADKGSKESLVITDDSALIVSVKNKTVITAMDRGTMKENVFTNIDSTVLV